MKSIQCINIRRTNDIMANTGWNQKGKIDILFCTTYIVKFLPKNGKIKNQMFARLFASQNSLCGYTIFNVHAHHIDRWTIFARITVLCRHTHILLQFWEPRTLRQTDETKRKKNWWVTIVIFGLLYSCFWKQMHEDVCKSWRQPAKKDEIKTRSKK